MEKELRVCPEDKMIAYCFGECSDCNRKEKGNQNLPQDKSKEDASVEEKTAAKTGISTISKTDCEGAYLLKQKAADTVVSAYDSVERPQHYASTKYEAIDIIKDKMTVEQFYGFLCGNVLKYMMRWQKKNGLEDLKKARWYLSKLIEEKESQPTE